MRIGLSEEAAGLRDASRRFVRNSIDDQKLRRHFRSGDVNWDAEYTSLASIGLVAMMHPLLAGMDVDQIMLATAMQELGTAPFPGPLLASPAVAHVLGMLPDDNRRDDLLGAIGAGEVTVALALSSVGGPSGTLATQARRRSSTSAVVSGVTHYLPDAMLATHVLVRVQVDGVSSLAVVPLDAENVDRNQLPGFAPTMGRVVFRDVVIRASDLIPADAGVISDAVRACLLPLCWYAVGAQQQLLDMTVEYTNERVVFGQPIGRFQRVQDHVVDLTICADAARLLAEQTLETGRGAAEDRAALHRAAAACLDGYYWACNYAHMVFAGIGTDYDHPLMPHTINSRILYQQFGSPGFHKRKMMDELFPLP